MASRRIPVLLIAAAGACASAWGLARQLAWRVPLREVIGSLHAVLVLALSVSVLACLALTAREVTAAKPAARPLSVLRTVFVVATSCWIAFFLLVHPTEKLWMEAGLGIAFGVLASVLLLEGRWKTLPAPLRKTTDVLLFSLCASAVTIEIALRALAEARPSQLLARFGDLPEERVRRYRMAPGHLHIGFPCNATGHYDDAFVKRKAGERRVIAIGDSFSLGVVPHAFHFTTVAERILGFPVDNMGIPSTGPPEYLRLLVDEALPLDPDLVVIDIFVGNDLVLGAESPSKAANLVRRFVDRNSVLLWLVPTRLRKMAEERRELGRRGPLVATPGAEIPGAEAPVEETASHTMEDPAATLSRLPWVTDPMLEIGSLSVANFRSCESGRATQGCTAGPSELDNLFQTLRAMQSSAGSTPISVMIIPDEYQVEDAVWQDVLEDTPGRSLDRDHPQKMLVPWLRKNGFEVLDLLPILRAVPPLADGRRHLYHLRNTHFNARGNEVTGKALAEFVRERFAHLPSR